jgi:hypothetical protein
MHDNYPRRKKINNKQPDDLKPPNVKLSGWATITEKLLIKVKTTG